MDMVLPYSGCTDDGPDRKGLYMPAPPSIARYTMENIAKFQKFNMRKETKVLILHSIIITEYNIVI